MDTQTQIDRLIELAIIQRTELKQLVEQLPQLREHLNSEVERTFEEAEPQIRTELEEFVTRQAADKTATLGVALEAKIGELAKSLEESAQAKYSALIATRNQNATLLAQAEERIAAAAGELPAKVKDIVAAELARFPRAGEIDQLRKEFAEPRGLSPRGKWQAGETYNKLDFVTINGDSYTSNIDGNRTRPSRSSADWTLVAARGTGGGGGPTSLSELTTVPSNGDILIGSGTSWVTSNLTAGAGISITVGAGEITISATDGDITLDDGTAAAPSLNFTADTDTGLFRPSDNVVGISAGGVSRATFGATSAINGTSIPANKTLVVTTDKLSALASTSSSELAGVISDETGTGSLVFANTPTLVTPNIGAATGTSVNLSGSGTFGGNLTVSGTSGISSTGPATFTSPTNIGSASTVWLGGNGSSGLFLNVPTGANMQFGINNSGKLSITGTAVSITDNLTVNGTGTSSIAGNLTVSGGTVGTAASTNLTLNGGSSGASLVLGQGTSAAVTITPTGGVPTTTLVGYVAAGTLNSGNVNSADATATLRTRGNLVIDGTGRNANGADSYLIAFHADSGSVNGFVGSLITSYINGANFSSATYFKTRNGATAAAEVGRFTSSGNLLIGTTTDSGNGKLQLATHTTSAGGIGFGTDVSLYRGSAGYAVLSVSTAGGGFTVANSTNGGQITAQSAGTPMFLLSDTTQALNEKLWGVRSSSASFIIGAWTDSFSALNNAIKIDRSGATPSLVTVTPNLTVSSTTASTSTTTGALVVSGGVGVAGAINAGGTITSGGAGSALLLATTTNADSTAYVAFTPQSGTGKSFSFGVGGPSASVDSGVLANKLFIRNNSTSTRPMLIDGSTDAVTFSGAIAIGNTVNTVSPTSPNRTITMVIGGTTYYLHAKTTND